MSVSCGIVGLPNVGKSTLFNALTQAGILAQNYPFCTIDPNVGVVSVPDPRLADLAAIVKPQEVIPTTVTFIDIAGLVAGAAQGEGLGNQFLANIRETDAIAHVVRCFEDDNIVHVSGQVSPLDDIAVINLELILSDLETVQRRLQRVAKLARTGDKQAKIEQELLETLHAHLDQGLLARQLTVSEEQFILLQSYHLLTMKPTLYIANTSDLEQPELVKSVQDYAQEQGSQCVVISAELEAEIAALESSERDEFLQELGLEEAGLDRVIRAAYALLGLETFFTAGPKEVKAWTFKQGSWAPQAAGVIHSDFEKGFIRAEVVSFQDYHACGGEQGAKEAGKWRLEGKTYRVQDGDVIHFRFNV